MVSTFIKFVVCFSVALFSPFEVFSETIFVSLGGDNTDGLSEATAFTRIHRAFDKANPGDNIEILDGVYTDSNSYGAISGATAILINKKASKERPINIYAKNPGKVVIDGLNLKNSGIFIYRSSHVKIRGIELRNFLHAGIRISGGPRHHQFSKNILVSNCYIHHIGIEFSDLKCEAGNSICVGLSANDYTEYIVIKKSRFSHIGRQWNPICDYKHYIWDHGIYCTGNFTIINQNIFEFANYSGFSLKLSGMDLIVNNNIFIGDGNEHEVSYSAQILFFDLFRNAGIKVTQNIVKGAPGNRFVSIWGGFYDSSFTFKDNQLNNSKKLYIAPNVMNLKNFDAK